MDDEVSRPAPPQPLSARLAAWVDWFGPLRLVTSAVAVVVVCVGAWFLVRAPVPPPEASLPLATGATSDTDPPANSDRASSPPAASSVPATPPTTGMTEVVIHVAGAVREPGVYRFVAGSRVADAVERAGGATADGRPHLLNLAAPLLDGMRVRVPADGEAVEPWLARDVPAVGDVVGEAGEAGSAEPVDVNEASVTQLEELPGIGPATAAAIVAEREQNGPFVAVDDLERVPGIGPSKLARVRDLVTT